MQAKRNPHPGIRIRHARACPAASKDSTAKCQCDPTYEASVYDARESRRRGRNENGKQKVALVRKTFRGPGALAAAKAWRRDASPLVANGAVTAQPRQRLEDAVNEWLAKCAAGEVLSKRRTPYAPATLRDYRADLETYVLPTLGHRAFQDITADDVQTIVEDMNGQGRAGQTVRNAVVALQAFYRHHRRRIALDPTDGIDLPEPGAKRNRAATVVEAAELLAALPADERDIYATAFYTGLRRGELQALRVEDIRDLDGDSPHISVSASWDQIEGAKAPKSKAGARQVPIPATLQAVLAERVKGKSRGALVFGRTPAEPFTPNTVRRHAEGAWAAAAVGAFLRGKPFAVDLDPIGLHECRHTYATWLDHSGVSEIRAARYLGHSLGGVTAGYTHQLAAQLAEDGKRLEAYLTGAAAGKVVALAV